MRKLKAQTIAEQMRKEFKLGKGGAEAIALAQASRANLVLMEDRNGVNACKILKLPFAGVLGVLLRMGEKGLISKEEGLQKLDLFRTCGRYRADIIAVCRQLRES